ncbi:hypothetical protein KI387_011472, partial [Taxus chinensis]
MLGTLGVTTSGPLLAIGSESCGIGAAGPGEPKRSGRFGGSGGSRGTGPGGGDNTGGNQGSRLGGQGPQPPQQ